jgi:hypothetical protein
MMGFELTSEYAFTEALPKAPPERGRLSALPRILTWICHTFREPPFFRTASSHTESLWASASSSPHGSLNEVTTYTACALLTCVLDIGSL